MESIIENKFEKYNVTDERFNTIFTTPDGKVVLKLTDYLGKSKIKVIGTLTEIDGRMVYRKTVKKVNLMKKFNDGVGLNLNFIELLSDDDIIMIDIGKKTYVITKMLAMIYGIKLKQGISGFERQIFIPLRYWQGEK